MTITTTTTLTVSLTTSPTTSILSIISQLCGWIYTLAWSLSFYPQPILNLRRRSTAGTTIDFPAINILGFAAYFASNASFLYSKAIRDQYAARHHGLKPTVEVNDLAFAAHAVLLSVITYSQFYARLWGWDPKTARRADTSVSRGIRGVILGCLVGVGIVAIIVAASADEDVQTGWAWIDVVYAVSYVKILVTLIKYTPQILTNMRNRSTRGWSIAQILLDFAGGILSLVQLGLDSYVQHDWSGVSGNPVKFALGNFAIVFDVVFMVQHYWLYADADAADGEAEEEDPLLAGGEQGRRPD